MFYSIALHLLALVQKNTLIEQEVSETGDVSKLSDDQFDDSTVIVILKKEYSKQLNDLSEFDFSKLDFINWAETNDLMNPDYGNTDDFRRIIKIKLKNNGRKEVSNAIEKLSESDYIKYVGPNMIVDIEVSSIPNDEILQDPTNLIPYTKMQLSEAWDITTGSRDVIVANNEPIEYTHEDLIDNMWHNNNEIHGSEVDNDGNGYVGDYYGCNFISKNGDVFPTDNDHGTFVAGVIGATGDNNIGTSGVAQKVSIMSLVMTYDLSRFAKLVDYLNKYNVPIYNISERWSGVYDEAFKQAFDNYNGLVTISAGNLSWYEDRNSPVLFPAAYAEHCENIITVAATDNNDNFAYYSRYDVDKVAVAAPGTFTSTAENNSYRTAEGTSYAAPVVAGIAALIKSKYSQATTKQLKDIILKSVDVLPSLSGKVSTGGRVNACKALKMVANTNPHLELDKTNWSLIPYTATSNTFIVSSDSAWEIIENEDWISTSITEGVGNDSFEISVSQNEGETRTGTVKLRAPSLDGHIDVTITITQKTGLVNGLDGIYQIQDVKSERVFEWSDSCVQLYDKENYSLFQQFKLSQQPDNTYIISQPATNKILTASEYPDDIGNYGIEVWFDNDNGGDAQRWYVVNCDNGLVKFTNKVSGYSLTLDTIRDVAENGTTIIQGMAFGSYVQKFKLILLEFPESSSEIVDGVYEFSSYFHGSVLNLPNENTENFTHTDLNYTTESKFIVKATSDGFFTVQPFINPYRNWHYYGEYDDVGPRIINKLNNSNEITDFEKFSFEKQLDGMYRIVSKAKPSYSAVFQKGSTPFYSYITFYYSVLANSDQKWRIYRVGDSIDKGDVDLNSKITPKDIKLVEDYLFSDSKLTTTQQYFADVDEDGKITVVDLNLIKDIVSDYTFIENGIVFKAISSTTAKVCSQNYRPYEIPEYTGSITIPGIVSDGVSSFDVVEIDKEAFKNCSNLKNVYLSNYINYIGEYAFSSSGLESVSFPKQGTGSLGVDRYAFYNCNSLKSVTLSEKISSIEEGTFSQCSSLEEIIIPSTVTDISENAFEDCSNLTIYGFDRSYAEEYALNKNIDFVCLDKILYSWENSSVEVTYPNIAGLTTDTSHWWGTFSISNSSDHLAPNSSKCLMVNNTCNAEKSMRVALNLPSNWMGDANGMKIWVGNFTGTVSFEFRGKNSMSYKKWIGTSKNGWLNFDFSGTFYKNGPNSWEYTKISREVLSEAHTLWISFENQPSNSTVYLDDVVMSYE